MRTPEAGHLSSSFIKRRKTTPATSFKKYTRYMHWRDVDGVRLLLLVFCRLALMLMLHFVMVAKLLLVPLEVDDDNEAT